MYAMESILVILILLALTYGIHSRSGNEGENYKSTYESEIKGPKSFNDRIAIIGAGPSGIHMAYLLKEKGFKNVEILEKTNRVGGKSLSINYRGAVHEMGTTYLSDDYKRSVYGLIKRFTNSSFIIPPMGYVWTGHNVSQSFDSYVIKRLSAKHPSLNVKELMYLYITKIMTYCTLHKDLFGNYNGPFMPEPSSAIKQKIQGTFLEFLKRNGLEDIRDLLTGTFTLQGYGHLDETPALYGLMWNTPTLLLSMARKAKRFYMLSNGFEQLWKSVAKYCGFKISYDIHIRRIYIKRQSGNKKINVYYRQYSPPNFYVKSFDFLIWTPPAIDSLKVIGGDDIGVERKLFTRMENSYYTKSLIETTGTQRSLSPNDWWFDNIYSKRDMLVWASRDSYASLNKFHGVDYQMGKTPTGNDNSLKRASVFCQYSKKQPRRKIIINHLIDNQLGLGADYMRIHKIYMWPYFPRFNQKDVEKGYHWRVLDIQGRKNIWFTGGSVSFESIKSVVEYNELLLQNMKIPKKHL